MPAPKYHRIRGIGVRFVIHRDNGISRLSGIRNDKLHPAIVVGHLRNQPLLVLPEQFRRLRGDSDIRHIARSEESSVFRTLEGVCNRNSLYTISYNSGAERIPSAHRRNDIAIGSARLIQFFRTDRRKAFY